MIEDSRADTTICLSLMLHVLARDEKVLTCFHGVVSEPLVGMGGFAN